MRQLLNNLYKVKNENLLRNSLFIIGVSVVMFFTSCSKDILADSNASQSTSDSEGVAVKNGMLVFKDLDSFDEITDKIANFDDFNRVIWEEKVGFNSQRRIVSEIIKAEQYHDSMCYIWFKDVDIEAIDESDKHSDIYNKYLGLGVIKEISRGTDDEYWDYSIFNRGFIDYINGDGFYAIGDTIYQVTSQAFKTYKLADFSKIELLKNATSDDVQNNIEVKNMVSTLKTYDGSPGLIESNWVSSGNDRYSKRIKIGIFLDVRYYIVSATRPGYQFFHEAYVQCQQKNFWKTWKYEFTDVTVNGSWIISMFDQPQNYSSSWSYNNSVSYLKASINPGSGTSAPYQSYFTVYCDNPSPFNMEESYHPPHFDRYAWSANRDGGCCGLTVTLNK